MKNLTKRQHAQLARRAKINGGREDLDSANTAEMEEDDDLGGASATKPAPKKKARKSAPKAKKPGRKKKR